MTEDFLHYIWKYNLYKHDKLQLSTGELVEVINPGEHNTDAGPDFFNTRVKIGETTWAGNAEIHLNASDWRKHGHQDDPAYDNVVLHLVLKDDEQTQDSGGKVVPTAILDFDETLYQNYHQLLENQKWIPCEGHIQNVDQFSIWTWLGRLMVERLEQKSFGILQNLKLNKSSWEETCYQLLMKNFGFSINAEPFELLSKSLPYKILNKHGDQQFQLEALLLGQAGFLEEDLRDEYYRELRSEYHFLRHKFNLAPLGKHLWKFARLRPSNFPTLRLAQLAALFRQHKNIFSAFVDAKGMNDYKKIFQVEVSAYWKTHYSFNKKSNERSKRIGQSSIELILINTIAPLLFVYGKSKDNEDFKEKALNLLESVPPEKNSIISRWCQLGVKPENAGMTQALIELKKNYCNQKRCLQCMIGSKIINR